MAHDYVEFQAPTSYRASPGRRSGKPTVPSATSHATPEGYADEVVADVKTALLKRLRRFADSGVVLPAPDVLAGLLESSLPDVPDELDPHFADVAPFYDSAGALRQLGGITKQALASRRSTGSVLAMRTGDGTWLYPAWQFTGDGRIHPALMPVLRALRESDGWVAGVWLTSPHPDLDNSTPRHVLRAGADPEAVADLARHDLASLVA